LTIVVAGEKVLANAALVACRCEEILALPKEDDKKKKTHKKHEVKLKQVPSGPVMTRILEYLYTGTLDFPKVPHVELLQVNIASRALNLSHLNYIIEKWVKENLSLENAFHLLRASHDMKETTIRSFCIQFALSRYAEFISNKDGIAIIGIDLFQEVVALFQSPPPAVDLPARPPADTFLEDFKKLYIQMPYTDATITIDNEVIRCHKAVLAAHSEVFQGILKDSDKPEVKGVSVEAFKSLLRFIYYGETDIEPLAACELIPFSRQYKMVPLQRVCENKIRVSIQANTIVPILKVAYMPETEAKPELANELKNKGIPFTIDNITEINLEPLRMHPKIVIDILTRIQKDGISGGTSGPSASPAPEPRRSQDELPAPAGIPGTPPPPARMTSTGNIRRSGSVTPSRDLPPPPGRDLPPPPSRDLPPPPSRDLPPPPSRDLPPPPPRATSGVIQVPSSDDEPSTPKGDSDGSDSKKKMGKKEEEKLKKEEEKRKKEEEKRKKAEDKKSSKKWACTRG